MKFYKIRCRILLLTLTLFIVYILVSNLNSKDNRIAEDKQESFLPVYDDAKDNVFFLKLADKESCPLCYGTDACKSVITEEFTIIKNYQQERLPADNSYVMYHKARSPHGEEIDIKVPLTHIINEFDSAICNNASLGDDCDVTAAVQRSSLYNYYAKSAISLKKVLQFLNKNTTDVP